MTDTDTDTDGVAAAELATSAGAVLVELRKRGGDPAALRAAGDEASNAHLLAELARRFPDDAVLTEEGSGRGDRSTNRRVWIIDPLDGTREFGEQPRDDWAVHVALVEDGELVAGAVALPALDQTLSTARPPLDRLPGADAPRILVSRTRPAPHAEHLAAVLGGTLVPMGSAGAKAAAVIRGAAEIYAHAGGQYEWDSAAPVAVAAAAGLHVSRLDGSALRYNQADPWLPDVLICVPELADAVIAACADHAA